MSELKKVVGFKIGDFENDKGEKIHFAHLFVLSTDENVVGLKAEKFSVADDDVLNDVTMNGYSKLYFNDKKKVVLIQQVEPTEEDRAEFYDSVS